MINENVSTLKINKMTNAQYERELAAGNINENELYLTPDENDVEINLATPSEDGLMSAADKAKLDGLSSTPKIDVDSELSTTSTNPVQNKVITNSLETYEFITTEEIDAICNATIKSANEVMF